MGHACIRTTEMLTVVEAVTGQSGHGLERQAVDASRNGSRGRLQ